MLLEHVLTRDQQEAGLTLMEDEDIADILCLRHQGHTLASFYSLNVEPAAIRAEAESYLQELRESGRKMKKRWPVASKSIIE